MKRFGLKIVSICLAALCLAPAAAAAQPDMAQEITKSCQMVVASNEEDVKNLTDGKVTTGWHPQSGMRSEIEILLPSGGAGSLVLQWKQPVAYHVDADAGDGYEVFYQGGEEEFLTDVIDIPQDAKRLRVAAYGSGFALVEIAVYGRGELPQTVQVWQEPSKKADILIIAAHPDDDLLYFGGTMPYYGAEMGKSVQVVYMSAPSRRRMSEALDGLWTVGIRQYPVFGPFEDVKTETLEQAKRAWDEEDVFVFLMEQIRRFQPDVVLSHDLQGEYGHGAHMLTADVLLSRVLPSSMDADVLPEQAAQLGTWMVPKCYLHLYGENKLEMDWNIALERFDGRLAIEVAREGYQKHVSQAGNNMDVRDRGTYSSTKFGLAYTNVGLDAEKNDFLENISREAVQALNPQANLPATMTTPESTPEPTPELTPAATPELTPEPTPAATPESAPQSREPWLNEKTGPYVAAGLVGLCVMVLVLCYTKGRKKPND